MAFQSKKSLWIISLSFGWLMPTELRLMIEGFYLRAIQALEQYSLSNHAGGPCDDDVQFHIA